MIDESTLESLFELNNSDLTEKLYSIEEDGKFQMLGIDKLWDVLHCFLTNESATNPIEGNKLSEAIIGIHNFHFEEDANYITCTEFSELSEVIIEMEKFNFKERKNEFNWNLLKVKKIYPNGIWETPQEDLFVELESSFSELLSFYKSAIIEKKHVVISVL